MSKPNKTEGYPKKRGSGENDAEDPFPINKKKKRERNKFIPLTQEEEEKKLAELENEGKGIIDEGEEAVTKAQKIGGEPETVAELKEEVAEIAKEAKTIVAEAKGKTENPESVDKKNLERAKLEAELAEIDKEIEETELFESKTRADLAETGKEQVKENIDTEKEEETQADEEKEEPKNPSPEPGKELLKIEPTEEEKLKEWRETIQKNIIAEIDEKNELRMREGKPAFTTEEKDKMVLDRLIEERDIFNGKKKEASGLSKTFKKFENWWLDPNKDKVAKAGINATLTVIGTYLTGYLDKGIITKATFRAISAVATTGIITSESGQKKLAEIIGLGGRINDFIDKSIEGANFKYEEKAKRIAKRGLILGSGIALTSALIGSGLVSIPTLAVGAAGAGIRYGITKGRDYLLKKAADNEKKLYEELGKSFDIDTFEKTPNAEMDDAIEKIRANNLYQKRLKWGASGAGITTSVVTADLILGMHNSTGTGKEIIDKSKITSGKPLASAVIQKSFTPSIQKAGIEYNDGKVIVDESVSDKKPLTLNYDKKTGNLLTENKTYKGADVEQTNNAKGVESKESKTEYPKNKPGEVNKKPGNQNIEKGNPKKTIINEGKRTNTKITSEKNKIPTTTKTTEAKLETVTEDAKKIGLNENAIVHKGKGITDAFANQLKADHELAKKLGFEGNFDDKHDLATFTKKLAIATGYIDEKGNEIKVLGINKTAYLLEVDDKGNPIVHEAQLNKMQDGTQVWTRTEDHKNGTNFEGKDPDKYEYVDDKNKPSSEPKTDHDGPTRASENSGPTLRTSATDDNTSGPTDTPSPAPTPDANLGLDKYTYENVTKSPVWEKLTNEDAQSFLNRNPAIYTPEEEKIRHLLKTELTKARSLEKDFPSYFEKHKGIKIFETLALAHNISHDGYTIDDQGVLYSPEEMKNHLELVIKQGNIYHNTLEEIFQKKGGLFSRGGMDQKLWEKTGNENMINFLNKSQFAKELKMPQENLVRTIKLLQERLSEFTDKPIPTNSENVRSYFKRLVDFAVEDNKVNVKDVVAQIQKETGQIPSKQN